MENHENRIMAGVLKSGAIVDISQAGDALATDIAIVSDPERAKSEDLWPCIWALAAVLERQFSGNIVVDCGLHGPLPSPCTLSSRCSFQAAPKEVSRRIYLGIEPPLGVDAIWGDARGGEIAHQQLLETRRPAHPIACFALAGYLGFSALAQVVGIPPYRSGFCVDRIRLPFSLTATSRELKLSMIGLGQLGQAYLSLLFFISSHLGVKPSVVLIDKDRFEPPNRHTQILLPEQSSWNGSVKAIYLEQEAKKWGWQAKGMETELAWGWRRPSGSGGLVLLGLDDLEVRRMAVAAGYDWIVDAGVGESFRKPRISWHSLPPDNALAKLLFPDIAREETLDFLEGTALHQQLMDTPGQCGWVTFRSISAAAPSMGITAAAFALAELLNCLEGDERIIEGRACLWSTMLPYYRTVTPARKG